MEETAAAALSRAAALSIGEDSSKRGLQSVCERLIEHPAVLAAAILAPSGEVVAGGSNFPLLLTKLRSQCAQPAEDSALREFAPPTELAANLAKLAVIESPLDGSTGSGPKRLCVVVAPSLLVRTDHASFIMVALVIAGIGVLSWWSLRRYRVCVQIPLQELVQLTIVPEPEIEGICQRSDRWGEAGRRIAALRADLKDLRSQVRRAELHFGRKMNEQAKRIHQQLKKVERNAWIDHLTGLYNRRYLDEQIGDLYSTQKRSRKDLTAVMFDLDGFKRLNDAHGHSSGDQALEFAGQLLRECTRIEDVAVRYGGDEFLLLLPGIDAGGAANLSHRLIAMFTQRLRMLFPDIQVSMTAGVASLGLTDARSPRELILLADRALYQAKRKGKRTVCTHGRAAAA